MICAPLHPSPSLPLHHLPPTLPYLQHITVLSTRHLPSTPTLLYPYPTLPPLHPLTYLLPYPTPHYLTLYPYPLLYSLSYTTSTPHYLTLYPRLAHSADEYNLHGAKRLFTISNVLSASRPSVNLHGENKPFLHIEQPTGIATKRYGTYNV